jgi:hypothetical protein
MRRGVHDFGGKGDLASLLGQPTMNEPITKAAGFHYVAGVSHRDDGRVAETFLNANKGGTALDHAASDSAVVASIALQHGLDAETLRRALMRKGSGGASGPLGVLLDLLAGEGA